VITESPISGTFFANSPVKRQIGLPVLHQTTLCIVNRITAENEQLLMRPSFMSDASCEMSIVRGFCETCRTTNVGRHFSAQH